MNEIDRRKPTENDRIERDLIAAHYNEWLAVLQQFGEKPADVLPDDPVDKTLRFVIVYRDNPETLFKGEIVECLKINELFEKYTFLNYEGVVDVLGPTAPGEEWIVIHINPADVYRAEYCFLQTGVARKFMRTPAVKQLEIAISNQGRSIECFNWADTPGDPLEKEWWKPFFKAKPEQFNQWVPDVKYSSLLDLKRDWRLIQGSTFERLKYILHQVKIGNVIKLEDFKEESGLAETENS